MEQIITGYLQSEITLDDIRQWIQCGEQSEPKQPLSSVDVNEFVVYFLSELHAAFYWILKQENNAVMVNQTKQSTINDEVSGFPPRSLAQKVFAELK